MTLKEELSELKTLRTFQRARRSHDRADRRQQAVEGALVRAAQRTDRAVLKKADARDTLRKRFG